MKNKNLSLKLAALLIVLGSFAIPTSVYAMDIDDDKVDNNYHMDIEDKEDKIENKVNNKPSCGTIDDLFYLRSDYPSYPERACSVEETVLSDTLKTESKYGFEPLVVKNVSIGNELVDPFKLGSSYLNKFSKEMGLGNLLSDAFFSMYNVVDGLSACFKFIDELENKDDVVSDDALKKLEEEADAAKKAVFLAEKEKNRAEFGVLRLRNLIAENSNEERDKALEIFNDKKLKLEIAKKEVDEKIKKLVLIKPKNKSYLIKKYLEKQDLSSFIEIALKMTNHVFESLQKKYDEFLRENIANHKNKKEFEQKMKAFHSLAGSIVLRINTYLTKSLKPSLYDLFTDSENLEKIAPRWKGLFKKLFGEQFAEMCKNEMERICCIKSSNFEYLKEMSEKNGAGSLFVYGNDENVEKGQIKGQKEIMNRKRKKPDSSN